MGKTCKALRAGKNLEVVPDTNLGIAKMDEVKKCPYCGEEVLAVAKKCKHCGEWLDKAANKDSAVSETVKADNSAKLENLYKVARRAVEDRNYEQAFKKYEQLQMEDPDNWEPNFYTAYYSGLNSLNNSNPGSSVRISGGQVSLDYNYRSGIAPCIRTIHNCIDTVFSLIEDIQDYEEQKAAIETVNNNVMSIADILTNIIDSEHQRMISEISHYCDETEDNVALKAMQKSTMKSKNNNVKDSYKEDVLSMVALVDSREKRLEEVVGKRRFDEYWDAHKDKKVSLESEKSSLNEQITKLNKDIKAIPGYTDMVDAQQRLEQEKNNAMSSVDKPKTGLLTFGIVAGIIGAFFTFGITLVLSIICGIVSSNKKKSFRAQQADVGAEFDKKIQSLNEKHSRVVSDVEEINKNISSLQGRVNEIDTELTKPR